VSNPVKSLPYDVTPPVRRYQSPSASVRTAIDTAEHEVRLQLADDGGAARGGLALAPLGGVLDSIDQGIVLLRSDAFPCFSNSAAQRLLLADGQAGDLERGIRSVSREAMRSAVRRSVEVEVETLTGRYRMRATMLLEKIKEISNRAVLVTIERAQATLPSRDALMKRFGMTSREADVALMLARGARNTAIASEMHISPHTARHHTENVLGKLGVHARAEVARAIADGFAAEPAPDA
jgi:DNA-binding CsgD family transcriptional regulator